MESFTGGRKCTDLELRKKDLLDEQDITRALRKGHSYKIWGDDGLEDFLRGGHDPLNPSPDYRSDIDWEECLESLERMSLTDLGTMLGDEGSSSQDLVCLVTCSYCGHEGEVTLRSNGHYVGTCALCLNYLP